MEKSFINEIKDIENDIKEQQKQVIDEIANYFKEKFDSDNYKEYLKRRITDKINSNKGQLELEISFWEYHSGCSATHFECSGYRFELPSEEYKYKGIRLLDIQEDICIKLYSLLFNKLNELGLNVVDRIDKYDNLGYFERKVIVRW